MSGNMRESLLKILESKGITQKEMRKTRNAKEFQQLLKRKEQEKQIQQMGFQSIEDLQRALKKYKEEHFPEDCIPEQNIDFSCLDKITDINFDDFNFDFDFSFLDKKEE